MIEQIERPLGLEGLGDLVFDGTLDLPPSVNIRYGRNGHLTEITRNYQDRAAWQAVAQRIRPEPTDRPVAMRILIYRNSRRGDIDNYEKALIDALKGVVYVDDRQIRRKYTELMSESTKERAVLVTVWELDHEQ